MMDSRRGLDLNPTKMLLHDPKQANQVRYPKNMRELRHECPKYFWSATTEQNDEIIANKNNIPNVFSIKSPECLNTFV